MQSADKNMLVVFILLNGKIPFVYFSLVLASSVELIKTNFPSHLKMDFLGAILVQRLNFSGRVVEGGTSLKVSLGMAMF